MLYMIKEMKNRESLFHKPVDFISIKKFDSSLIPHSYRRYLLLHGKRIQSKILSAQIARAHKKLIEVVDFIVSVSHKSTWKSSQ